MSPVRLKSSPRASRGSAWNASPWAAPRMPRKWWPRAVNAARQCRRWRAVETLSDPSLDAWDAPQPGIRARYPCCAHAAWPRRSKCFEPSTSPARVTRPDLAVLIRSWSLSDAFRYDVEFWGRLQQADSLAALRAYEPPERVVYADELRLDTVAEAFAKVIDAKSPFTARHSQNVAFLATRTAVELGMPRKDVRALRRAALLHDVGKLGVSNSILDKPQALDSNEILTMQRHTGHTFDILSRVARFQRFAGMAASHHERLDGTGYHLGLKAPDLSLAARVLAVADVCEALSADRPYRAAIALPEVMERLTGMAADGALCPVVTEALIGWFGRMSGIPGSHPTAVDDSTSLIG